MIVKLDGNPMVEAFREKARRQGRCFICYPFRDGSGQLQYTAGGKVAVRPDGRVIRMAEFVETVEGRGAVVGMVPTNRDAGRVALLVRLDDWSGRVLRTTPLAVK